MAERPAAARGGAWLLHDAAPAEILTPEGLTDEHRLFARTAGEFVTREVLPALDRLEQKDWELARALVVRCGELGLLGADVPERLGGLGLDISAAIVVGEAMGGCASFATTFGAQTGLALTPLLLFGTAEQQQQYVPRLVTGELIGAYALSESGSGSDALSARARAVRQDDGSFVLDGEKMWITNGGFADLFVVFAKVVDPSGSGAAEGAFTAFLVERGHPGVTSGREEHKLGLHGSSTTPLILHGARVPAGAVLGEIGKGHKVAFNVLNYGRLKLGAMCSGGARRVIAQAVAYAAQRKQFGRPLTAFGAVRQKLADMAIREYAVEAMLYRTSGAIDALCAADAPGEAAGRALEEYAVEASILKVAGSEMLDAVTDENVQIHGGNGFVRDYPAERHFRDARVNRIFEGTNEINRLVIAGMLARRAAAGALPLASAGERLADSPGAERLAADAGPLAGAAQSVAGMKHAAILVLGTAMQSCGERLSEEQEILLAAADVLIDTYAAESAVLRAAAAGHPLHAAAAAVFASEAGARAAQRAGEALTAMLSGDRLERAVTRTRIAAAPSVNTIALRREVADAVIARRMYPF